MHKTDLTKNAVAGPTAICNAQDGEPYFIDPLGELNFTRLFGAEQNKALTITFLNHVLKGKREIVSLEFLKNEYPDDTCEERRSIIDMMCKDRDGDFFIVEIQKHWEQNFKDRSLFFGCRLINGQASHVNPRLLPHNLKDVYVIALLEQFTIGAKNKAQWRHDAALCVDTGNVISEELRFTYIELLNFTKAEDQLENELEKWVYALKNLKHLKQAPAAFTEPQLLEFCEAARYINLPKEG